MAQTKRKAYAGEEYWGKPITGFGDPNPARVKLLIVGLAPAAHGANRTGRIFTGDRSGDWLYRALHKAGYANQPTSTHRRDGLQLRKTYITCVVKCAPPDNKPSPVELKRCTHYLEDEIALFENTRVFLALGQIALAGLWPILVRNGLTLTQTRPHFSHGGETKLTEKKSLLLSYHPSQQNTFTGRLTEPMFDSVFDRASKLIEVSSSL